MSHVRMRPNHNDHHAPLAHALRHLPKAVHILSHPRQLFSTSDHIAPFAMLPSSIMTSSGDISYPLHGPRVRKYQRPDPKLTQYDHKKLPPASMYKYEPLDTTKQQIRLLKLQNTSGSAASCEISTFDMGDLPSYVALSYAWDEDSKPRDTIMLNDKRCHIGQTLCAFFQHFQERSGTDSCPWLWIDQICINQSEVREKNHQIPLMSCIYSQCASVIAWLGRTFSGFDTLLNDRYFTRLWII
jgi:hypothetical protein